MSAKDTLGNAPGLKEHEAKQNRVGHSSPNRPNGIAACCDALNEHCVNCNTYKDQQPLKAHGKQGLDVVLPGATKLPVGKRSNGDGGQTGQQIDFQHPAIHQNENDNSHRLHREANERRLQPQPQKRPQVHRLQRGFQFSKHIRRNIGRSFGGGTNSAALLIGLYKHKIPIDLITFADTGAEHPHTYQFIEIINQWLAEHGMPQITVVQYVDRYGNRLSLETECLRSHTLPSIAYGHKRCSQKHKIAPQEKFCNHYAPCREVWQRGEKVNRYIGYDAGEVKRYEHSRKYNEADKKYHNRYPLIEEWGWNRDDCIREIKAAGLPQPGKSSCFFCPSMKKQEILYLKEHYPDLFNRAATLEENAMPYLKTVKGLGRSYSWKEQFGKE